MLDQDEAIDEAIDGPIDGPIDGAIDGPIDRPMLVQDGVPVQVAIIRYDAGCEVPEKSTTHEMC